MDVGTGRRPVSRLRTRLLAGLRSRILAVFAVEQDRPPQWTLDLEDGTDAGFFTPDSAAWTVHGGVETMVAGIRALLLQAAHPGALAGVHDWSRYREDPLGRLDGTIRWIFTVTYGDRDTARRTSDYVLKLHERVVGEYLDAHGVVRPYAANDPDLLRWVHLAFTDAFLSVRQTWGGRIPGGADAYVADWALAGELMGVVDPPRSEAELARQLHGYLDAGELTGGPRVDETLAFLRRPPLDRSLLPAYGILFAGAVATIPPEYRRILGLRTAHLGPIPLPVVTATRVVLWIVGLVLHGESPSQRAALRRHRRLADPPAVSGP
ncbi:MULTISPECIES: oxygenase MpaB family protein [Plantibacter]|uniref:oxygenase MpaB family protein n=1 Tax=Plantibacter TaxID=190323 RepID=UPI001F02EF82|nr:oxygenase MpaB family protein [Plantibacter flavus]